MIHLSSDPLLCVLLYQFLLSSRVPPAVVDGPDGEVHGGKGSEGGRQTPVGNRPGHPQAPQAPGQTLRAAPGRIRKKRRRRRVVVSHVHYDFVKMLFTWDFCFALCL